MNLLTEKTVIIGAGISGLYLAQLLSAKGENPLILEKSKGLGGRVATRRINDLGLDHGALFLDHHPYLSAYDVINTAKGDYLPGGMNALAKKMSHNLRIMREQKLHKIIPLETDFELETEEGLKIHCKNLILTAPVPQAVELMEKNLLLSEASALRKIQYSKAIILLGILKGDVTSLSSFDFEGHEFNFTRERNLHPHGLVLKLSSALAESVFERSDTDLLSELINVYRRSPLSSWELETFELKKWRFSKPLSLYPAPFAKISAGLYLCGDGFGHPLESAEALAKHL